MSGFETNLKNCETETTSPRDRDHQQKAETERDQKIGLESFITGRYLSVLAVLVPVSGYSNKSRLTTQAARKYLPFAPENISENFSQREFIAALQHLTPGKAFGPDFIGPEFILYARAALKSWLNEFFSACADSKFLRCGKERL